MIDLDTFFGNDSSLKKQPEKQTIPSFLSPLFQEDYNLENKEYFYRKKTFFKHDINTLFPLPELPTVLADYAMLKNKSHNNLLFLDTETTGLGSGTGVLIFLIGIGYFRDNTFVLEQFFLKDPAHEREFLIEIGKKIISFDTFVTYNGKSFDLPLLENRLIFCNIELDLSNFSHIDLLHLSRRLFRESLNNCCLRNIEQMILAITRDPDNEIEGREIPDAYFRYLSTGKLKQIYKIITHNTSDVTNLALLLNKISTVIINPCECEHLSLRALGKLYSEYSCSSAASRYYESLQKNMIEDPKILYSLSLIYKKRQEYKKAEKIWISLSENNYLEAMIELAKLYEHRFSDFKKALSYAGKALELVENENCINTETVNLLSHRIKRLSMKIEKYASS